MRTALSRVCKQASRLGLIGLAGLLLSACSTGALNSARSDFYSGRYAASEKTLNEAKITDQDQVLMRMERGMARQAMGEYESSSKDFIQASDLLDKLETYSVTKGGASMVANDYVQNYRGRIFERALLHVFTALNHFALANWDEAAVEGRRILKVLAPDYLGKYPDIAFAHYIAGFSFEMIDDASNAELEYRKASELAKRIAINPKTGHLFTRKEPETNTVSAVTNGNSAATNAAPEIAQETPLWDDDKAWAHELVCFVFIGQTPTGDETLSGSYRGWNQGYADISAGGKILGRSYSLTDTAELSYKTEQLDALFKAAKAAGRIAVKEGISQAVENSSNDTAGLITRLILFGLLEQPDTRKWETLPRLLQVARIPCDSDLKELEVTFRSSSGAAMRTLRVESPLSKRRVIFVSFFRDLPAPVTVAPPVKAE